MLMEQPAEQVAPLHLGWMVWLLRILSVAFTCGFVAVAEVRKDRRYDAQTPLPDLPSAHQLARPAVLRTGRQERRDPRATARGRGPATTGRPATTFLARPRRARGADRAAASPAPAPSAGGAGDVAALAPPAGQAPLDEAPPPARRPPGRPSIP